MSNTSEESSNTEETPWSMRVHSEVIFGPGEQAFLAAIYGTTLVLGLLSNAAIIWVILGDRFSLLPQMATFSLVLLSSLLTCDSCDDSLSARKQNHNPRNMYIVNLSVSGIIMTLFCVPPTFLQVLYGGWWHLGVVACKLVPLMQGDQKQIACK